MNRYNERREAYRLRFERALKCWLEAATGEAERLGEAMRYAVNGTGKRVRPILLYATADALRDGLQETATATEPDVCAQLAETTCDCDALLDKLAVAVELVHGYSLIHDDLPCMDNDAMRRGRPTTHIAYGEALAVLAGDALQCRAFELMLDACANGGPSFLRAARLMGRRFGQSGMVAGQAIDFLSEDRHISLALLRTMDLLKTSALIEAAVMGGAAAAGAEEDSLLLCERYAAQLGLAFQIRDDILDATVDSQSLGKTAGKDMRDNKSTYLSLLGVEAAEAAAEEATDEALCALSLLSEAGWKTDFLEDMTKILLRRGR